VGGVLRWVSDRLAARAPDQTRQRVEERGTLLASGLIAGEAIVGILLAVLVVSGVPSLTRLFTGADELSFYPAWGGWLSLAGFAVLAWVLVFSSVSGRRSPGRPGSA